MRIVDPWRRHLTREEVCQADHGSWKMTALIADQHQTEATMTPTCAMQAATTHRQVQGA